MQRIPTQVLLAPFSIYRREPQMAEGYRPTQNARFAVVRRDNKSAWLLVHRKSGSQVSSLLPPRKVTLTEMLAVCAAWEAATHLDWSPFDQIPETTRETTAMPAFADINVARRAAHEMRALVVQAIGD